MSQKIAILLLGMLPIVGGCGTALNLRDHDAPKWSSELPPRTPYGGVQMEVSGAPDFLWRFSPKSVHRELDECGFLLTSLGVGSNILWGTYIFCVDLPLTAIGDTVTLPYVLVEGPGNRYIELPDPPERIEFPTDQTIEAILSDSDLNAKLPDGVQVGTWARVH